MTQTDSDGCQVRGGNDLSNVVLSRGSHTFLRGLVQGRVISRRKMGNAWTNVNLVGTDAHVAVGVY